MVIQSEPKMKPVLIRTGFALLSALIAVFATTLVSCEDRSPILIGFSGQLSGRNSQLAIDNRNSFELAVKERNEQGGIRGRPLEILVADDANSLDIAVAEDKKLIEQGVSIIVGHFQSTMIAAMNKVMSEHEVLYVTPIMSAVELKGKDDMLIRTIPTLDEQGIALAEEALRRGVKSAASIFDINNKTYAYGVAKTYGDILRNKGLQVSDPIPMDVESLTFTEIADRLLATGAETFLLSMSGLDCALLAQQIRKKDTKVLLMGPNWAHTEDLLSAGGNASKG